MPNPIVFSKMGSVSEIENPENGIFLARNNMTDFRPCKFDNGTAATNLNGLIDYESDDIDNTKGCCETWLLFVDQDIVNGVYTPTGPSVGRNVFSFGGGSSTNSMALWIYSSSYSAFGHAVYNNAAFRIQATNINIPKNTLYHVAVTWDDSGIDGSSDKLRLYVDGVIKAADTVFGGPSGATNRIRISNRIWSDPVYSFESYGSRRCSMDNFKMWDYAKTDFSDRFIEGGAAVAKRPFSNKYFGGMQL